MQTRWVSCNFPKSRVASIICLKFYDVWMDMVFNMVLLGILLPHLRPLDSVTIRSPLLLYHASSVCKLKEVAFPLYGIFCT